MIVKSPADTDRFLWDFRRTIGELLAENHYGEISPTTYIARDELLRRGAGVSSSFAWRRHGDAQQDRCSHGRHVDLSGRSPVRTVDYMADLRGAASVAHIYGQNLVGAESMTSRGPAWSFSPNKLKKVADLEFALGVNRFEIHESAHQPVADMAPGPHAWALIGLWFNRNETWAEEGGPWVSLSGAVFLLAAARATSTADVAYFYGEEGPLTAVFGWKANRGCARRLWIRLREQRCNPP
jgi:hypothetical protein